MDQDFTSFIIKLCLLGEANVGKTSLVYRFIENKFRGDYKSTLGVNLLKKDMIIESYGEVSAQIWDLGGQESFKNLRKLYFDGANGALMIYDATNKKSFEKMSSWIQDFKSARGEEPLVLIGNKNDLTTTIKVNEEEGMKFAKANGMEFVSTSAKTGENVEKAFFQITKKILDKTMQK
jgi:small GTP-binding protein